MQISKGYFKYQFMKKIVLGFILAGGVLSNCFAQSEHRISLGAGLFGHAYINEIVQELEKREYCYPGPKDHGTYTYLDQSLRSLPTSINLHYEHTLGNHFGVGICLGYDRLKMRQEIEVITSVGEQTSSFGERYTVWESSHESAYLRRHVLMILPEFTVYWFKKNHVAMYSKVAPGIRFSVDQRKIYISHKEETEIKDFHFTCQGSPVCVEFGGQYWRGFAEFGYGAQGIAQFGVKHTFRGKRNNTEE